MDKHADDRDRKWRKKRYGMRINGRSVHVILRVWEKRSKEGKHGNESPDRKGSEGK